MRLNIMTIISDIRASLVEWPVSDILRERIVALIERNTFLEAENAKLVAENIKLKIEIHDLEADIFHLKNENQDMGEEISDLRMIQQEFVEARGALFKRLPGGGFDTTVYCPGCRVPLSGFGGDFVYRCDRCDINLDFTSKDVPDILKGLS